MASKELSGNLGSPGTRLAEWLKQKKCLPSSHEVLSSNACTTHKKIPEIQDGNEGGIKNPRLCDYRNHLETLEIHLGNSNCF
jgi:hypothetical protein